MNERKEHRLRELLSPVFASLAINDQGNIVPPDNWDAMLEFGKFLAKEFKDHVARNYSAAYPYFVIKSAVRRLLSQLPAHDQPLGILTAVMSAAQQDALKDDIVGYFDSLPHVYEYRFPLPQLGEAPFVISFGGGVGVRNEEEPRNALYSDTLGSVFGGLVANAMNQPPTTSSVATLYIQTRGLAMFEDPVETASELAIYKAKVCIQLACAVGLFRQNRLGHKFTAIGSAKYMQMSEPPFDNKTTLPPSFGKALADIGWGVKTKPVERAVPAPDAANSGLPGAMAVLADQRTAEIISRAALIGRVVSRLDSVDRPEAGEEATLALAGRIATSATWGFDANSEEFNSSRVLRTAIALEALFGGGEKEAISATLVSRLQYALGRSPVGREHIKKQFPKFYELRSKVVHRGRHRLSEDDENHLRWADALLSQALDAELKVMPDVVQRATFERVQALPLAPL